jgi:hypothetical protein
MLIGAMCAVGDSRGRGKIPINKVSLNINASTLKKDSVV